MPPSLLLTRAVDPRGHILASGAIVRSLLLNRLGYDRIDREFAGARVADSLSRVAPIRLVEWKRLLVPRAAGKAEGRWLRLSCHFLDDLDILDQLVCLLGNALQLLRG